MKPNKRRAAIADSAGPAPAGQSHWCSPAAARSVWPFSLVTRLLLCGVVTDGLADHDFASDSTSTVDNRFTQARILGTRGDDRPYDFFLMLGLSLSM